MVSISAGKDRLFRNLDCVVARLIIDNHYVPSRARLFRHQHVSQAALNVVCLIEGWDHNAETGVRDALIVAVPKRWS
jgi:hypothetical protein